VQPCSEYDPCQHNQVQPDSKCNAASKCNQVQPCSEYTPASKCNQVQPCSEYDPCQHNQVQLQVDMLYLQLKHRRLGYNLILEPTLMSSASLHLCVISIAVPFCHQHYVIFLCSTLAFCATKTQEAGLQSDLRANFDVISIIASLCYQHYSTFLPSAFCAHAKHGIPGDGLYDLLQGKVPSCRMTQTLTAAVQGAGALLYW
jgi:hypothetical protein